MANTSRRKKGRNWKKHPDDPGRTPYRVVNLYALKDRMILAYGADKPVHEGHLLFQATIGRSYWGHSAKAALGFCLRVCRGFAEWRTDQYVALPDAKWLDLIRMRVLPNDALPDLPETRRAAIPPSTKPSEPVPAPVDPLAPTDPPPAPKRASPARGRRFPGTQLALAF